MEYFPAALEKLVEQFARRPGIGSKSLRKRRHIYLFNTEDLDNDDIIAMVEDSPTYQRDKTTLTKIRTKAALEEEVATEEAMDDNGVITF